jgi:predicted lipid-binding transport protein (Tim44 family)
MQGAVLAPHSRSTPGAKVITYAQATKMSSPEEHAERRRQIAKREASVMRGLQSRSAMCAAAQAAPPARPQCQRPAASSFSGSLVIHIMLGFSSLRHCNIVYALMSMLGAHCT